MKTPKISINMRIPVDLFNAIQMWLEAQPASPTMTSIVESALTEFIEKHGRIKKR